LPCPWYKEGVCTSPLLKEPSRDPVIPSICSSNREVYSRCRYYVEPTGKEPKEFSGKYGKPLLLIHSLNKPPRCLCEFFIIEKYEGNTYITACKVLNRYLTRYEVNLCSQYWSDCPYRKLGLKLGTTG